MLGVLVAQYILYIYIEVREQVLGRGKVPAYKYSYDLLVVYARVYIYQGTASVAPLQRKGSALHTAFLVCF